MLNYSKAKLISVLGNINIIYMILSYKVLLDLYLYIHVMPSSGVVQLDYGRFDLTKLLTSYLILLVIIFFLKKYPLKQVVSKLFFDLHLIILIIPMLALIAQDHRPLTDLFLLLLGYSVIYMVLKIFEKFQFNVPSPSKTL